VKKRRKGCYSALRGGRGKVVLLLPNISMTSGWREVGELHKRRRTPVSSLRRKEKAEGRGSAEPPKR